MKLICTLLLSICLNNLLAQDVEYTFKENKNAAGTVADHKRDVNAFYYFPDKITIGNYTYVTDYFPTTSVIKVFKYSKTTGKLVSTKTISVKGKWDRMTYYEELMHLNDKHYVKYSLWDKKNKKERLFLQEIDLVNGRFTGSPKLFLTTDKIQNYVEGLFGGQFKSGYISIDYAQKFPHLLSADSNKIFFYHKKERASKNDAKNNDRISVTTYDKNLKPLGEETYTIPVVEKYAKIKEYIIADNHFYLVYMNNETGELSLVCIDDPSQKEIKIKTSASEMRKMKLKKIGDTLYLYGFGISKSTKEHILLTLAIDAKGKTTSNTITLSKDYVSNYYKNKLKNWSIQPNKMEKDENGNLYIVAEVYGQKAETVGHNGSSSTKTKIYPCYEDILLFTLKPSLELISKTKIPKDQMGHVNTSYAHTYHKGAHYFFYVNHLKNIEKSLDDKPKRYVMTGDGNLEMASVGADNKVKRKAIFRMQIEGLKVSPRFYTIDANGNIHLPTLNEKTKIKGFTVLNIK